MKKQSITRETVAMYRMDKRDLVNMDLYSNEIKVLQEQLSELTEKHRRAKDICTTVEHLKKKLATQKKNLEKFRQNYQVDQITDNKSAVVSTKNEEAVCNEGFFEHLKVFENDFKNIRNEVNDLINQSP